MGEKLRMYPRGFFGSVDYVSTARVPAETYTALQAMRKSSSGPIKLEPLGLPNSDVDELYSEWLNRPLVIEDWKWRERLLALALKAFGTTPQAWCRAQDASPYVGEHHTAFIVDCLDFAKTGKRKNDMVVWGLLVSTSDYGSVTNIATSHLVDVFAPFNRNPSDISWVEIVQQWVGQVGGYADLMHALLIFFGTYQDA